MSHRRMAGLHSLSRARAIFKLFPLTTRIESRLSPFSFFTFISRTLHLLAYQCRLVPVTPNTARRGGKLISIEWDKSLSPRSLSSFCITHSVYFNVYFLSHVSFLPSFLSISNWYSFRISISFSFSISYQRELHCYRHVWKVVLSCFEKVKLYLSF